MADTGHTRMLHTRLFLPRSSPALEANLDELSRQGWELVCFVGGWGRLPYNHFREDGDIEQAEAIFRKKDALTDEERV